MGEWAALAFPNGRLNDQADCFACAALDATSTPSIDSAPWDRPSWPRTRSCTSQASGPTEPVGLPG